MSIPNLRADDYTLLRAIIAVAPDPPHRVDWNGSDESFLALDLPDGWDVGRANLACGRCERAKLLKREYETREWDVVEYENGKQSLVTCDPFQPSSIFDDGKVCEVKLTKAGIKVALAIQREPTPKSSCATNESGAVSYEGYIPADTLEHDEGIKRQRLSELKRSGKIRSRPAPTGLKDSQGRGIRVLYNREDAIRECKPKRRRSKSSRKAT